MTCPNCNADITTTMAVDIFNYQDGIKLEAYIPYRKCVNQDCGFEYTDFEAEEIHDRAITNYLKYKVSIPAQSISYIREYERVKDITDWSLSSYIQQLDYNLKAIANWERDPINDHTHERMVGMFKANAVAFTDKINQLLGVEDFRKAGLTLEGLITEHNVQCLI